jgi:hypothetical protein
MKAQSSKVFKNPVSQALGLVLQRMRNSIGIPSEEMAVKLDLGASTYRMVESGSATLQPGKALGVIKYFERIEFEPLCKLLIAIQVMDSGISSVDDMQTTAILLGETDAELQSLLRKFETTWPRVKGGDPNKVSDAIKVSQLDMEVERFLTSPTVRRVESKDALQFHVKSLLEKTPPFYFDLALDLLDTLQGYPPRVSASELSRWETKNKSKIANVYAILESSANLLDPANFNTFDYSFLWQNQFGTMKVIYSDQPSRGNAPQDVNKKFTKNLSEHLRKHRLKYRHEIDEFDAAIQRIQIKSGYTTKDKLADILMYESFDQPIRMRNFWLYQLNNGNTVAFIDNYTTDETASKDQPFYGTGLSYSETITKLHNLEEIWNALE